MINLMPSDMKEQIHFAKLNALVLRYVRVTLLVVVVLGGVFAGAAYLIQQQATAAAKDMADKQQSITELSSKFLPKAQDASQRLNAIKYVQDTQTKFSSLIADISKVFPKGITLDQMTLTGVDSAPVSVNVTSTTYENVLALRDALITSPRISGADISSINSTTLPNGTIVWKGIVVIGFKPGQAK